MKVTDSVFFETEKLSPRKSKTPEGYLICHDVPISKVGTYDYREIETNIEGLKGIVHMTRTAEELFSPETMASFEGKPVVVGHDEFADPSNYQRIAVGHIQNVRRDGDSLLADLLLTSERGITLVESGRLKEVSCGYDCEDIQDEVGYGHQAGIVGNHVALVENARVDGCRIGDGFMSLSLKNLLRRCFKDGDEDKFNEQLDSVEIVEKTEAQDEESEQVAEEISAKDLLERLVKAEERIAALEEAGKVADEESDPAKKPETKDEEEHPEEPEMVTDEEVAEAIADAEVCDPSMKKPVCDSADGKFTRKNLEMIQRRALKASGITTFGDADSLEGKALGIAVKAAAIQVKANNNPSAKSFKDSAPTERLSIAELNRKFWGKK